MLLRALVLSVYIANAVLAAACNMTLLSNTCLQGSKTYKTFALADVDGTAAGCCDRCMQDPACTHWTLNLSDKGDECRLKDGNISRSPIASPDCTSGTPLAVPTPAPVPTPPPTPLAPTPAPDPHAPRPNIIAILADDLGWYDTAVYNPASPTPRIAELCADGLRLDHHHVFRYCSPTRRSLLSGRFPNHISTAQPDGTNLCSDFLPLNLTTLAEKLKRGANYTNHYVGKGHLGYETMDHLPINRGFDDHVGFLGGSEGYAHGSGDVNPTKGKHDMWHDLGPGIDVVPEMYYSANYYAERAISFVEAAGERRRARLARGEPESAREPFFMYYAIQNVHSPYTLPPEWETKDFPNMCSKSTPAMADCMWDKTYANMLAMLDGAVANVTDAVKEQGLWNETLILFTADNGGITKGNNYPLRGHKHDAWEGGTRATAFLAGGFLPTSVRGTATGPKFVHISDWYPTWLGLAGVDPSDPALLSGAYRDIDGVDVWPLLTGTNTTQPRLRTPTTEVSITDTSEGTQRWWKLITLAGQSNYYFPNQTAMPNNKSECLEGRQPDPAQPGRTDALVTGCPVCNETHPCLFDILQDPRETTNLAAQHPKVVMRLAPLLKQYEKYYVPGHLTSEQLANYDKIDAKHWRGYEGPCYQKKNTSTTWRVSLIN